MFVLDTMVLSELQKRRRHRGVTAWLGSVDAMDLFLSAVTIGEIEIGIEKQKSANPAFAAQLSLWIEHTVRAYGDRIISVDVPIARRWGRLAARTGNRSIDLAIAATALEHGLTVVTRNVRHFTPTGVPVFNPYSET